MGILDALDPGTMLKNALDSVLPQNLHFLADAAGGALDLQMGNPAGAAQNFLQMAKDMPQPPPANGTGTSTATTTSSTSSTSSKPAQASGAQAASTNAQASASSKPATNGGAVPSETINIVTISWTYEPSPPPKAASSPGSASPTQAKPAAPAPATTSPTVKSAASESNTDARMQGRTSATVYKPAVGASPASPTPAPAAAVSVTVTTTSPEAPDAPPAAPAATSPTPSPAATSAATPATTPATSGSSAATGSSTDPSTMSKDQFMALSDDDFINAVASGKIPPDVAKTNDGMLEIQARMNQISQMNQLMTSMMQAMHQMNMSVIQNVRA